MVNSDASLSRLVEVWRGDQVESVHHGVIAVSDRDGHLLAGTGDPGVVTYMRSAAKPVQLTPLVESGAAEHFGFSAEQLAIMAASHTGRPEHVDLVQSILDRIGLPASALQCGAHQPFDATAALTLQRAGEAPGVLHNNCSGKHAGMLAYCQYHKLSTNYLSQDHPLQRRILTTLARLAGVAESDVGVAVDGCGAPCYALPLGQAARLFAQFANPSPDLDRATQRALTGIREAMAQHPSKVGGPGRFDTELMQLTAGRVVAKSGAESFQALMLPDRGLGVAMKVADGQGARAIGPVVVELLHQLGICPLPDAASQLRLDALHQPLLENHSGVVTGRLRAVYQLWWS